MKIGDDETLNRRKVMAKGIEINKNEFLKFSSEAICQIVLGKKRPEIGIFTDNGNRRLVKDISPINLHTESKNLLLSCTRFSSF
jgi:hypothetical protein